MTPFQEALERWHDFHLMSGTAAATLIGLLFVSVSIHVEVLFKEEHRDFRQLALEAFQGFIYILILSLFLLAPAPSARIVGLTVLIMNAMMFARSSVRLMGYWRARRASGKTVPAAGARAMAWRAALPVIAYAMAAYLATSMFDGQFPIAGFIGPMLIMLGSSTRAAWDLLENVARSRHERLLVEDERVE
jgi:hypothetical protein